MKRKKWLGGLLLLSAFSGQSQDMAYARKVVDTLTAPYFWGRGYTNNGMAKAADYLMEQYRQFGIQPVNGKDFRQRFTYPANTFPGRMELRINGKELEPGKDFIVLPESGKIHAKGKLQQADSTHFVNPNYRFIVSLENKLTWSAAQEQASFAQVLVNKKSVDGIPYSFQADIEAELVKNFEAANVCAWIKGTQQPDSIILITAHYDHLGGMGSKTYFPGANDNASGTALVLSLAKYYAEHPQPYTIAFIHFAGEEIGLTGSKYFTEHPLFPLKNIRFMLNLDLEGTGDDGITVVNATEYPEAFQTLNEINKRDTLLKQINMRGKAANSDHYFFTEKKVPAFFWYTLGGISAYHDIYDRAETLPLNKFESLFKLIVGFNKRLMGVE